MVHISEWLVARGHSTSFEDLPTPDLAEILKRFYDELRKKDGTGYSKAALVNVRASLNRHLVSAPHNRQINIMRDKEFLQANHVFVSLLKDIRREGRDVSQHKEPISPLDFQKLYTGQWNSFK